MLAKTTRHLLRFNFCQQQITKNSNQNLNSIQPGSRSIAYGHYFPGQWNQSDIQKIMDPSKQKIIEIQRMKNKVGEFNGKILFQFVNKAAMDQIISKYNQDYITTKDSAYRVVIRPFQLKTQLTKREHQHFNDKNHVKVKNLNFQTTENQIRKLAESYGEVQHIQMEIKPNGLNRGLCDVYFRKKQSAQNFMHFIDGFQYDDRKLSATVVQHRMINWRNQIEKEFLQTPKYVFAANRQLAMRESLKKKDYIDSL